jgi:hypothetical protein
MAGLDPASAITRHPDESQDRASALATLSWIPAFAGMTLTELASWPDLIRPSPAKDHRVDPRVEPEDGDDEAVRFPAE